MYNHYITREKIVQARSYEHHKKGYTQISERTLFYIRGGE